MKNMSPLKFFTLTLALVALLLLAPAGLVAVFDPFFVYHKPWLAKVENPHGQDRMQNAGLINHWLDREGGTIDTIFVGTSMSQNFPLDERSLRLTLSGGRALEIRYVTEKALATGKVKNVVWEIFGSYSGQNAQEQHPESPLPLYMYNKTRWDDWRYFVNADVVGDAAKVIVKPEKSRKPMAEIYTWGRDGYAEAFKEFSSPDNIRAMNDSIRQQDNLPLTPAAPQPSETYQFPNIAENLLPVLRAHPDVRFMLYFPPVPYYGYLQGGNEGFWREMKMREDILKSVAGMKNVTVHGFDLVPGLGDTLSRYKDSQHYDPEANAMMLEEILAGRHAVTAQGFTAYRDELVRRLRAQYDVIVK